MLLGRGPGGASAPGAVWHGVPVRPQKGKWQKGKQAKRGGGSWGECIPVPGSAARTTPLYWVYSRVSAVGQMGVSFWPLHPTIFWALGVSMLFHRPMPSSW